MPLRLRVRSLQAWSVVAHNFRGDWQMLSKEIAAGFLIAGYVATLPSSFFRALFVTHAWAPLRIVENVLVGPIVAALAFVCSIGNVPLAAVLWAGGGSFAGVLAFLYGDLIVLPLAVFYRKVYGGRTVALLVGVCTARWCSPRWWSTDCSPRRAFPVHRPSIASVAERPVLKLQLVRSWAWRPSSCSSASRCAVGEGSVCGATVDRHAGGPTWFAGLHDLLLPARVARTPTTRPEAYS